MKQTVPQVIIAGQNLSSMSSDDIAILCLEASQSGYGLILRLVEQYLALSRK